MLVCDLLVNLGMEMTCIHMSWQSEAGQSYFRRRFRPSPLPSSQRQVGLETTLCCTKRREAKCLAR
jgi:hypothetical protein